MRSDKNIYTRTIFSLYELPEEIWTNRTHVFLFKK